MDKYQKDSIKNLIGKMDNGTLVLPSIQRTFVWSEDQIVTLFDSIMRGYPIGTFMFWDVEKNKIKHYGFRKFNDFYNEYHKYTGENDERPAKGTGIKGPTITGVLDGQQRLTSLFIGFHGDIFIKTKNGWNTKKENYSKKELYIDINHDPEKEVENEEIAYNFKFLDPTIPRDNASEVWVKVKDIADWDKDDLADNRKKLTKSCTKKNVSRKILTRLWNIYNDMGTFPLYYYVANREDIKDVLNIFERANQGGTPLSRTHLLFSIITSSWKEARAKFNDLEGSINQNEFCVDTDYLMKNCLFLIGSPVNLSTDTFSKAIIQKIENNWDKIQTAISETFTYLYSFGYRDRNIISYNAIIPLTYFFYNKYNAKGQKLSKKVTKEMQKYLLVVQTKGIFRSGTKSVLNKIRDHLENNAKGKAFSMKQFDGFSVGDRNLIVDDDFIESLLEFEKGKKAFAVLSLLYSDEIDFDLPYQMDHMHPESAFTEKKLRALGLTPDDIKKCMEEYNKLPNLQLLKGQTHSSQKKTNQQKSKMELVKWLKTNDDIYLPKDSSGNRHNEDYYELKNFLSFYDDRKEILRQKITDFFEKQ